MDKTQCLLVKSCHPNTFGKTAPLARQVHDEFVLEGPSDKAQEAGASAGSLWFLRGE